MNMHISQGLPSLATEGHKDRTPASASRDAQLVINPLHPAYIVAHRQLSTEILTLFVDSFLSDAMDF